MVAERRRRCLPQEHGSASSEPSARRGGPDVGMPVVAWSPCPHPRSASTRPVSGVRASGAQVSVSGCPAVRVSGCPASMSARSASPSASIVSAPVTSWSASVRRAATRPGGAGSVRPGRSANGSGGCPSQGRPRSRRRPCWASGDVGLDLVVIVEALGQRTGFDPLAGQGPPVVQDRPSVWEQVCALCTPTAVAWLRAGRQGQGWRHAADHDLGWTAATTSGARVVDWALGSPAPAGSLAQRMRRACGPTAAQAGRERDRVGRASPLSWENSGGPART